MSEPTIVFAEGLPSEPSPMRFMTVENLIANLTTFAEFYEAATAAIDCADVFERMRAIGTRDVNADVMRRDIRATHDIERVRRYTVRHFGVELTVGTARRVLSDLLQDDTLSLAEAQALSLGAAMDRLTAPAAATSIAPPSATSTAATPHKDALAPPPPVGLYADLSAACEALKLRGNQRGLVEAIVAAGKPIPIADLHLALELEGTVDAGWGNTVNPINLKLKAYGLRITRVDSQATLSKIGVS